MPEQRGVSYDDFNKRPHGVSYEDFTARFAPYESSNTEGSDFMADENNRPDQGNIDYENDPTSLKTYQVRQQGSTGRQAPVGSQNPGNGGNASGNNNRPQPSGNNPKRPAPGNRGGQANPVRHIHGKKRHPIKAILIFIVIVLMLFLGGSMVLQNMKSTDQWKSDYVGTWQVDAIGMPSNPLMSLATSFAAGNATDLSTHMILGITDMDEAQITNFGLHKEYAFSFTKGSCEMNALNGDGTKLTGGLIFGKLFIRDNSGTITLYKKVADTYIMNYEPGFPDTAALLETAQKVASEAGPLGQQILDRLQQTDPAWLEQYMLQTDPQKLQELVSNFDTTSITQMLDGIPANDILVNLIPGANKPTQEQVAGEAGPEPEVAPEGVVEQPVVDPAAVPVDPAAASVDPNVVVEQPPVVEEVPAPVEPVAEQVPVEVPVDPAAVPPEQVPPQQ